MTSRLVFTFALLSLLFSACEPPIDNTLLLGQWQAVAMVEADKVNEDITDIRFNFSDADTYTYQGGPSYQEAGHYRIQGDLLYSTDTLAQQRVEKVVRIIKLTSDTLFLQMNKGGLDQEMRLVKSK